MYMRLGFWLVVAATIVAATAILDDDGSDMPSVKAMYRADMGRLPPAWLRPMLEATYFEECPDHPPAGESGQAAARVTNSCNFFCTDCAGHRALCAGCRNDHHAGHRVIQIRRSSGHGVVRVADVAALLDVSLVQTYLLNGEETVYLNKRPVAGQGKGGLVRCEECDRALLKAHFRFCSVGCKLKAILGELDFTVSFAVHPKGDNDSSGAAPGPDADRPPRPTKPQKTTGPRSARATRRSWAQEGAAVAANLRATAAAAAAGGEQPASSGGQGGQRRRWKRAAVVPGRRRSSRLS